jgi:quinol monooxygenase YgiN
MLIRTVRMTFRPDALEAFAALFEAAAPRIRAFPGCRHLELWRDASYPNILTTYSHWSTAEALEQYRTSDLFKETWRQTRPLFSAPPRAISSYRVS